MKDEYRRFDRIGTPDSRTRWTMRRLALAAIGETTFLERRFLAKRVAARGLPTSLL